MPADSRWDLIRGLKGYEKDTTYECRRATLAPIPSEKYSHEVTVSCSD